MDNLELNIDFVINSPEIKAEAAKAKAEIQGVADSAAQANQRVQDNLKNVLTPPSTPIPTQGNLPQQVQVGLLEGLRKQLEEAKKLANSATEETTVAIANAKIEQYERELKRLSMVGREGINDIGNEIVDSVEKPLGKLQKLQKLAGLYANASAGATNPELIEKYNRKLQETQISIGQVQNVGKVGFDKLGNAIQNNGNIVSKFVALLYRVGNILPGIGVAGILAFAIEPIIGLISQLDIFKKKLTDIEKASASMQKSLEGGGEYAKAVAAITSLRVNVELAKDGLYSKQKVVEEYNKSIGAAAGQVKTLEQVEKGLANNAENYVKMTLYKAAAQQTLEEAGKKAAEAEKKRTEDESNSRNKYFTLNIGVKNGKRVNLYTEKAKEDREAAAKAIEEEAKPLESIAATFLKKAADFSEKMGGMLGLDKSEKVKTKGIDKAVDAAESLQRRVLELSDEYSRKSKTKDEEELQALRDKFFKMSKEVSDFNKNPKNRIKVDGSELNTVRDKAIEDLTFRQQTEKLKVSLETQKGLYEQYESYKKDFGEEKAKQRFEKELDLNKTYISILEDEQQKLMAKGDLTGGETERLDTLKKLLGAATLEKMKADDVLYKQALDASKTYEEKALEIERDFEKKRTELAKNKSETPERLLELYQAKKIALDAAKDEALQKTAIYQKLASDTIEITRSQVIAQLKVLKELLNSANVPEEIKKAIVADVEKLNIVLKIGVEQSNLDMLQQQFTDLSTELSLRDSAGNSIISDKERKRIIAALTEVQAKIKSIDVNGDGKATFADKLAKNFAYLKGTSTEIAQGLSKDLSEVSSSFGQLSSAVGGTNTQLGITLSQVGQLVEGASKAANSFAAFSAGDFVGGITSAIGAISSIISLIQSINATVNKEIQDFYTNAIRGEQEYQDLLKQRSLDLIRENKTTLKGIEDEIKLRKQNLSDYAAESASILEKVAGMSYKIRWIDTDGLNNVWGLWKAGFWEKGSLAGKTTEELTLLLKQGALDDDAKLLVERLVELEQKGFDAKQVMKDLAKQIAELFTGTTADSLTNSLVQLFEEGKTSAQDFADFFQKAMSDAALAIFKNKILAEAMNTFYEQFSMSVQDGGLSKDEIASLNTLFSGLMDSATKEFDMLKEATGLSNLGTSTSSSGGSVGTIARQITEQTGSELTGISRSQYDITTRIFDSSMKMLDVLKQQALFGIEIQNNTANTVTELKNAVTELKAINTNTKPNSTAYDRGL